MGFNSGFNGLIQLSSWGWAHGCSKHVEDLNKSTIEEIVPQVGYPAELFLNFFCGYMKCDTALEEGISFV